MENTAKNSYLVLAERVIAQHPAFESLRPDTREHLLRAATVRKAEKGEAIAVRGQPMEILQIVISGSLEVSMQVASGKRFVRWYLEPGQMQGFIPMFDGKGAIYDTSAHTESLLLQIPRAAFMTSLANDPALALVALGILCERSRAIHETAAAEALLILGKH